MVQADPRHDPEEQPDARYASFAVEDGIVLYDTENPAAWIQSDTAHDVHK